MILIPLLSEVAVYHAFVRLLLSLCRTHTLSKPPSSTSTSNPTLSSSPFRVPTDRTDTLAPFRVSPLEIGERGEVQELYLAEIFIIGEFSCGLTFETPSMPQRFLVAEQHFLFFVSSIDAVEAVCHEIIRDVR